MDNSLFERIAKDVEKVLVGLEDRLIEFTIGKTENPNDRELHYDNLSYTHFCEICKGKPSVVNEGEKYLISYFDKHPDLKRYKANERDGGGGNPNANILYVAIRNREKDINNLDGNILPFNYPIEI